MDFIEKIHNGLITNKEIVQQIELLGSYLGLKTIAQKAKELNTDYNNVKKSSLQKIKIFNVNFIIDND